MKQFILLIIVLVLSGCVTVDTSRMTNRQFQQYMYDQQQFDQQLQSLDRYLDSNTRYCDYSTGYCW